MTNKQIIKYMKDVGKTMVLMFGAIVGIAIIDVGNAHNYQILVTIGFVMNFSCLIYLGTLLKGELKL